MALQLEGEIAGRYFNPYGRNVSGSLSDTLDAISNRKTMQMKRDVVSEEQAKEALVEDFAQVHSLLKSGEIEQALAVVDDRLSVGDSLGRDMSHTLDLRQRIITNPDSAIKGLESVLSRAAATGAYGSKTADPADVIRFQRLTEIVNNPEEYPEATVKAARVELGLDARAGSSAIERIAGDSELGNKVADQRGAEAEASESGRSRARRRFEPEIKRLVKLAEAEAKARGEDLTELARMEASLPTLEQTVQDLEKLIGVATYTTSGRIFDALVRETGFGATEGSTARAKMIALVDNQVLPLLRQTFGAAFTEREGETLKKTLLDPNAAPAEKRAQLDAFITNKRRQVEEKQGLTERQAEQQAASPASNYTIVEVD